MSFAAGKMIAAGNLTRRAQELCFSWPFIPSCSAHGGRAGFFAMNFLRCGEFPASRNVSMSSLGWYLGCAVPMLVSSGYVVWMMVFYLIERHRAGVRIDLCSRLREFFSECGADPSAGDERDLEQLRETLELLDELRQTPASSPSIATAVFKNIA